MSILLLRLGRLIWLLRLLRDAARRVILIARADLRAAGAILRLLICARLSGRRLSSRGLEPRTLLTLTLLTSLGFAYGLTSLGFSARGVLTGDLPRGRSIAATASLCAPGLAYRLMLSATSSARSAGRNVVCGLAARWSRRQSALAASASTHSGGASTFVHTLC